MQKVAALEEEVMQLKGQVRVSGNTATPVIDVSVVVSADEFKLT